MSSVSRFILASLVAVQISCAARYVPEPIAMDQEPITLDSPGTASFRARQVMARSRGRMRIDPINVTVDYAAATDVVVQDLRALLEANGVSVVDAPDAVEIEVVHISVRADNPMYCSADVTLHTASGVAYGVQGRGSSWNYEKACHLALADVGSRILQRQETRDTLFRRSSKDAPATE
jgi:hypothetical protein